MGKIFLSIFVILFIIMGLGYFMPESDDVMVNAAAISVNVPSDPGVNYSIVVKDYGGGTKSVVTKRDSKSSTSYSIREVNCNSKTFRYMGEGDTLEKAISNLDDTKSMSPVTNGSISYYILKAACK